MRQRLADSLHRLDVVDGVVVVFLESGRDGEDVRVEDDVLGREADFSGQQVIGAGADLHSAGQCVGLPLLIECHDDRSRPVTAHQPRLAQELRLALLHADGVDDRLALHAFQPGFDHRPLRRVEHHVLRHPADVRLGGDKIQERRHGLLRIQHRLVHVDVDDLRTVLHLLARDGERFAIVAREDQACECLRAGDVGAFADVDEERVVGDVERLEPR